MNLNFIKEAAKDLLPFERAKTLVSIFYFVQIPLSIINLIKLGAGDPGRSGFLPIWPVSWVGNLPYSEAAKIIFLVFLATSFFATIFWSHRIGKIVAFLGIFQLHALESSFGYINHMLYPWLYVSFVFMFLPNTNTEKSSLETRKKFLLVFWGAQALFLLTYSLAGLWKILNLSSFTPYAFALQVSSLTIKLSHNFFLSDIFIKYPLLGWPFYLGGLITEVLAFPMAFKPQFHKLWGLLLISLHTGILLFMDIAFFESILLLNILFLASPFQKRIRVLGRSF